MSFRLERLHGKSKRRSIKQPKRLKIQRIGRQRRLGRLLKKQRRLKRESLIIRLLKRPRHRPKSRPLKHKRRIPQQRRL
jgi:hypothetical protein